MEGAQTCILFFYFFYYVFKMKNKIKIKIYFARLLKIYEQMEDKKID